MKKCAPILLLLAASLQGGEVLDRIAVVAGDQVITESAIKRHIRLNALLRNDEPDFSPASKKEAAELLIRQGFVRRELELSRYTAPGMDDVEKQIDANLGRRSAEFIKRLHAAGFTEEDLKETFLNLVSFNRFVSFRFNPGVTISEEEVKAYYEKEYVPARLRSSQTEAVEPLERVQAAITRILEARKANVALDSWLQQTRQQVKIRYIEEVFQ